MNPQALKIMREALERISAIHKTTSAPAEEHDREELLEKLDFAVITAREALDRAAMPGECQN
jgi:predicted signal transduction protein with EAL and GGDEF domain